MSKRPQNSRAADSASEELVEHSEAAANDGVLLRELVENSDSDNITAVFAVLHTDDSASSAPNNPDKTSNRPCANTPNETFVDILLFMDRDTLEAMQLACRFLLEFVRDREFKELPLRSISQVELVEFYSSCRAPFQIVRYSHAWLCPLAVDQLSTYLSFAYCESVCVDLHCMIDPRRGEPHEAMRSAIFGEIILPNTFVHILTVRMHDACGIHAQRAIKAFNRVSQMVVTVKHYWSWPCFTETFFISAAERGVQSMKFETADKYATWGSTSWGGYFTGTDVLGALSFGFAEPTTGGDRSMSMMLVSDHDIVNRRGISGNVNFLAPLIKKASELDGRLHIDFKFTIDELYKPIDAVGFEKYQKSKRSWLMDDLENGITLEVVEREGRFYPGVEIPVYSSV